MIGSKLGGIERSRLMSGEERAASARHAVSSRWRMRDVLADRRREEHRRIIDAARGKSMTERLLAAVELTRATAELSRAAKDGRVS